MLVHHEQQPSVWHSHPALTQPTLPSIHTMLNGPLPDYLPPRHDPFNVIQPQHQSPPSTSSGDSDMSRASSVALSPIDNDPRPSTSSHQAERRRRVSPTQRRSRRSSGIPSGLSKKEKERLSRGNQKAVIYRTESVLKHYCGWSRQEQSGGNGNGAGLYANKIHIGRGTEGLFYHLLDQAWTSAVQSGNLQETQQQWQQIIDRAIADDADPYDGTMLQLAPGEQHCTHRDSKSKACLIHGTADWRVCRTDRVAHRWAVNSAPFFAAAPVPVAAAPTPANLHQAFSRMDIVPN